VTAVVASASACRTALATLEVQRIPNDQLRLQVAVGEAIRRRRLQRGMSQRELALAVGTHRPLVARLERGHLNNSLGLLHRYAVALECAVSEVLRDAEKLAARAGGEPLQAQLTRKPLVADGGAA
jgi:transcriptional regulator with XRE-family HTH domain